MRHRFIRFTLWFSFVNTYSLGINIVLNQSHSNFFCSSAFLFHGMQPTRYSVMKRKNEKRKIWNKIKRTPTPKWSLGTLCPKSMMRNATEYVFILLRCCFCYFFPLSPNLMLTPLPPPPLPSSLSLCPSVALLPALDDSISRILVNRHVHVHFCKLCQLLFTCSRFQLDSMSDRYE